MSVANSYAKALYEAAIENPGSSVSPDSDPMQALENQMGVVLDLLSSTREAQVALFGPVTTAKEKVALIEVISQKFECANVLKHFLILLARKGRLSLLQEIKDAFGSVRLTLQGGVAGNLVAAEAVTDADVKELEKAFTHKLGKKVAFRVYVDPSLLAGMKVTVNGVTYDGTLRSQLQKLRDRFVTGMSGAQA